MTTPGPHTEGSQTSGVTAPGPTTSGLTPSRTPPDFTHLDSSGHARMVDVTAKQPTVREATASGHVVCAPHVVAALRSDSVPKGDVLAVARIAGISAAKRTSELLPLAHVIGVHGATVDLEVVDDGVSLRATVRTADRTGVEMEALTAVSVAALAVVDMVKGMDRSTSIHDVRLESKSGGRSGTWVRTDGGPA
jgi:cyclic pyranopterin monophosphate synthase